MLMRSNSTILCAFLLTGCLLSMRVVADARSKVLQDGDSPEGHFRVEVSERPGRGITYDIVSPKAGSVIHRIPSSYQPEEGEASDWCWDLTNDAEVHWSPGGHYLVIDEQVHNYIGQVFLVLVGPGSTAPLSLPETQILAATKMHWDRFRIRFVRWGDADRLSLVLAGQVVSGVLANGRQSYEHRSFEINLRIRGRRAVMISCRDRTKET
jgi:hypothetical protein